MEYEEEMVEDDEDNISEEDEDGMGPIEGLSGEHGVDVEVIMEEDDDDDDEDDEDSSGDDDDENDSEDLEDDDARVEIIDEAGNIHQAGEEDDVEEWESDDEDDEEDYEGQADEEEAHAHAMDSMANSPLGHLVRALGGDDHEGAVEILQRIEGDGIDPEEHMGEYLEEVDDEGK